MYLVCTYLLHNILIHYYSLVNSLNKEGNHDRQAVKQKFLLLDGLKSNSRENFVDIFRYHKNYTSFKYVTLILVSNYYLWNVFAISRALYKVLLNSQRNFKLLHQIQL